MLTIDIFKTKSLVWLLIASAFSTLLGLILDWQGFLVSILSGLLGATIGIWISVGIIEAIIERQRQNAWNEAKDTVIGNITIQITKVLVEFTSLLSAIGPYVHLLDDINIVTDEKTTIAQKLVDEVEALRSEVEKAKLIETYKITKVHLDRLNEILMYHLLIPGQESELVVLLQKLDMIATGWTEAIMRDRIIGLSKGVLFNRAIDTARSALSVYIYLANYYKS